MNLEQYKHEVCHYIDRQTKVLWDLADYIWHNPEYNYQEFKSSKAVADTLERFGFSVERGICDIETAFRATYDSKKPGPHIAFLAEFDAVPGMGHACGHNLMAAMSVGAGAAVLQLLDEIGGKVSVFGTPAEEGGGGKVLMLSRGAFAGVDAVMIIHAANETVVNDISYSTVQMKIKFHGVKSHGATWPDEGISALDPLLLLFQHINQKRLKWHGEGTILGVIKNGGENPIYIPDYTEAEFVIRSFKKAFKDKLLDDFKKNCDLVAQMTDTRVEMEQVGYTYEDIRNNKAIEALLEVNFKALGETVMPRKKSLGIGCTDVGNISHEIPGLQSYVRVVPEVRGHTVDFENACDSEDGKKAMVTGAKALAMTALDLMVSKENLEAAVLAFKQMKQDYQ